MVLEGARYALLFALVAVVAWMAAGALFAGTPRAEPPFRDAGLCIHRPAR